MVAAVESLSLACLGASTDRQGLHRLSDLLPQILARYLPPPGEPRAAQAPPVAAARNEPAKTPFPAKA